MNSSTDLFDKEDLVENVIEVVQEERPPYGSKEWNDFVMAKFDPSEMIDGNPLVHGLRRVSEDLLGDIIASRPTQVLASDDPDGPGRATVAFEVVFDWMNSGQIRTYGDVADVWHGNTDDLFCAHPAATAATKAESRCLRKALKIRCVAAEEIARHKDVAAIVRRSIKTQPSDGDWTEKDSITMPQVNFIDAKCKQLDINLENFINQGEKSYGSINDVSKMTASKMLKILNEYQNNSKELPESIKGYKNWR